MILPLRVDAVLAQALTTVAAAHDSTPNAWLSELLAVVSSSRWTTNEISTAGPDAALLYREVQARPFDLAARMSLDTGLLELRVRQIDLAFGALTYCGLVVDGDAFFDGPVLVVHEDMLLPESLVLGLRGTRVGDLVATGVPALDDRIVARASQNEHAVANACMGWKGPARTALELHLEPVPLVAFDVEAEPPSAWWGRQED